MLDDRVKCLVPALAHASECDAQVWLCNNVKRLEREKHKVVEITGKRISGEKPQEEPFPATRHTDTVMSSYMVIASLRE